MDQDILGKIIEVEKEIQERIKTERDKAAVWLGKRRAEAEEQMMREQQLLEETFRAAASKRRTENEQMAAAMVQEAVQYAERLGALSDDLLRAIIVEREGEVLFQKSG